MGLDWYEVDAQSTPNSSDHGFDETMDQSCVGKDDVLSFIETVLIVPSNMLCNCQLGSTEGILGSFLDLETYMVLYPVNPFTPQTNEMPKKKTL